MRNEYRKAVKGLFTAGIHGRFPGLESAKIDAPTLFTGESVFRWSPGGGFRGFVLLAPSAQGRQSFTVEVAWSRFDRFPEVGMRPSVVLAHDDPWPTEVEEGVVRLGGLASKQDMWWDLPDPAMRHPGSLDALVESAEPVAPEVATERAASPVADALEMLASHGVPFLELALERQLGIQASPLSPE